MKNFFSKSLKAIAIIICITVSAFASTYTETLDQTLTVQNQLYSTAVNGSFSGSGSYFFVILTVKHPLQTNLRPRFWVNNHDVTGQLADLPQSQGCETGAKCYFYSRDLNSNPLNNPISGKLELKSNSGSSITITPGSSQKVNMWMARCSTIPTVLGGGC